ncbi:MAG: glyoxylase-like metal-dependent hydrolase (beta-lactamase superfamily II) [Planctomycetota bacterium]|jgi:glyoxylase-like metal-dependent hydrolase (beta-lactamase superfamily II)/rhodanese-related sulfurtransferase
MSLQPILKVVASDGCRAYLIACPETRECLLLDPKHGQQALYEMLLDAYDLKLAAVMDTHTHADHLSGSAGLIRTGVPLWMSSATGVTRQKRGLEHGEQVAVGELRFEALSVPGHTQDSMALYGHGMIATGDSLFIGGLARADFRGSDAAQLFESVQTRIMTLPEDTLVLPGHEYCDIQFSTVGCEGELNEALKAVDGSAYAAQLCVVDGAGNSEAVDQNLELNLAADPTLPDTPGVAAACCAGPSGPSTFGEVDEVPIADAHAQHDALTSPDQWVDVRDPYEYKHGHIPGTTNVPLSELGFHLRELQTSEPLYISCRSGVRSMTAAKTLRRLGIVSKPINVGGGILAWQDSGYAIDGSPST